MEIKDLQNSISNQIEHLEIIQKAARIIKEVLEESIAPSQSVLNEKENNWSQDQIRSLLQDTNLFTPSNPNNSNVNTISSPEDYTQSDESALNLYYISLTTVPKTKINSLPQDLLNLEIFPSNEAEPLTIFPLPQRPYYKEICKVLYNWYLKKQIPFKLNTMNGLKESENDLKKLEIYQEEVIELFSLIQNSKEEDFLNVIKTKVFNLFQKMKPRGILTLLRMRKTAGSIDLFPPSHHELIKSFNLAHSERDSVVLTVGARALTKHCIRSKDGWWGSGTVYIYIL